MSLGRHALLVTTGNILAQLCQLAALPFISRFADPTDFGAYTIFVGACAIAGVFAGLRYDSVIVVAGTMRQSRLASSLVLSLGIATALSLLIVGLPLLMLCGYDLSTAATWSLSAAGYVIANTIFRIAINWLTRLSYFSWIGAIQFLFVIGTISSQLLLLRFGLQPQFALIVGLLMGQVFAALWPLGQLVANGVNPRQNISYLGMVAVCRKYSYFPRYMIAYGLNSTLRDRMIQIIISWGAGAGALGNFAMAQRLVGAPQVLLQGGVGSSLLAYARNSSREEVAHAICMLIESSLLLLTPVFVFFSLNETEIFSWLFGPRWSGMGDYFMVLSLPYLIISSSSYVDRLFELYGQQRAALRLELGYSVVVLLLLGVSGLWKSGLAMAVVFSCVIAIYHTYYMYRTFVVNNLPRNHLTRLVKSAVSQLLVFVLINIALLMVRGIIVRAMLATLLTALVIAYYYYALGGKVLIEALFKRHGLNK